MITRENYEEYFLLYTDNELPAAERREVERFISEHPDLREEWEALLQCRIAPEKDLVFPGRASLLKPDSGDSRHTEELLLYLDGELDPAAVARIELLIETNPATAKAFTELQRTISHPDPAVVYPGKAGLYRGEKVRRIIPLPWVRAGIAASVAVAIVLIFLLPARRPSPAVATTTTSSATTAASSAGATASTATSIPVATPPSSATTTAATTPANLAPASTAGARHRNFPQPVTSARASALHHITGRRPAQDLAASTVKAPVPDGTGSDGDPAETILPRHSATTVATGALAGDVATANGMTREMAAIGHPAESGITRQQSSFATEALQEEANEERMNNVISDEPAAPGRNKWRGLFRKVTRAFEKTADRDGDGNRQLTVGAFQVSLN